MTVSQGRKDFAREEFRFPPLTSLSKSLCSCRWVIYGSGIRREEDDEGSEEFFVPSILTKERNKLNPYRLVQDDPFYKYPGALPVLVM